MKRRMSRRLLMLLLAALMVIMTAGLSGSTVYARSRKNKNKNKKQNTQTTQVTATPSPAGTDEEALTVEEDGQYTSKEEVALYLHTYNHLPDNYITKREAQDLGWSGGSLAYYAPGKSIGGGKFGNYEGILPYAKGRQYYECDIDYDGGKRNAKRIVYSSDGLIYYTEDHYSTFEQLY